MPGSNGAGINPAINNSTPPATTPTTGGGASTGVSATAFPVSAYLGAGLGLLQAYGTFNQNSQINDTSYYDDLYNSFGAQSYKGDFNSLIKQRQSSFLADAPSWQKIRGMNSGAKVGSAITSAGSGAMAGAGFGPWGMAAGAVIGGLASLLGSSRGDSKAKSEAARLQFERVQALEENQKNFLAGVNNAQQDVNFNAMANLSAFGGPLFLPSIGGAIDYELAQQKLAQQAQRNQGGISFPRYAFGGVLSTQGGDWSNGITFINNGGTHEENPMQGVPMGMDEEGNPNLVEEGEVIWNDYVFSDRIAVPDEIRTKYKLKGKKGMTFADAAKKLQRASEERPNDPIVKKTLNANMTRLAQAQEMLRQESIGQEGVAGNKFGLGSWLRYAPALGAGIGAFSDIMGWTNKPDYTNADLLLDMAGNLPTVEFRPVGQYLQYNPFDTLFYANQLNAQSADTKRAIRGASNGNRATIINGLLGADLNAQTQLGNLFRQAEEFNLGQRQKVAEFNRSTDMFNSEGNFKAQLANREGQQFKIGVAEKAAQLRDTADARASAAKSANLTNLFDSLGDIGREQFTMDMIKNNPALLYDWMGNYKGGKKACGGMLTKRH